MSKKCLHFGGGNIGRGFIGKLLSENGYHVTFADVNEQVIQTLHEKQEYIVNVVGSNEVKDTVKNVDGVLVTDPQLVEKNYDVNLITTAVGVNVLPHVAKNMAEIIKERFKKGLTDHLNIIACENMIRGTSVLRNHIEKLLSAEEIKWANENIGFADAAVDRIVPAVAPSDDCLFVVVEEFFEWDVDQNQVKGDLSHVSGLTLVNNLDAYIQRKLFTLNTGHAVCAYIGVLDGKKLISEAISDQKIEKIVRGVMSESGKVLEKRFGFSPESLSEYHDKIIERFKNIHIVDDVLRVGRQPLRKLGYEDRLIKPLRGTMEYGVDSQNLQTGIAHALAYINPDDEQANELNAKINKDGVQKVLQELLQVNETTKEISSIIEIYNKLK